MIRWKILQVLQFMTLSHHQHAKSPKYKNFIPTRVRNRYADDSAIVVRDQFELYAHACKAKLYQPIVHPAIRIFSSSHLITKKSVSCVSVAKLKSNHNDLYKRYVGLQFSYFVCSLSLIIIWSILLGRHGPSKPTVLPIGRSEVLVSWEPPECPLGRISRYEVYVTQGSTPFRKTVDQKPAYSGLHTSCRIKGLNSGTKYNFKV